MTADTNPSQPHPQTGAGVERGHQLFTDHLALHAAYKPKSILGLCMCRHITGL